MCYRPVVSDNLDGARQDAQANLCNPVIDSYMEERKRALACEQRIRYGNIFLLLHLLDPWVKPENVNDATWSLGASSRSQPSSGHAGCAKQSFLMSSPWPVPLLLDMARRSLQPVSICDQPHGKARLRRTLRSSAAASRASRIRRALRGAATPRTAAKATLGLLVRALWPRN